MSVARFFAQSQGKAFTDISTTTGTRQKHNKHLNLNFTVRPQPDPRPRTQDPSRLGGMHCENGRRAKGLGRGSFREPQTSAFGEPGKRPMEKNCTLAARTCQCCGILKHHMSNGFRAFSQHFSAAQSSYKATQAMRKPHDSLLCPQGVSVAGKLSTPAIPAKLLREESCNTSMAAHGLQEEVSPHMIVHNYLLPLPMLL